MLTGEPSVGEARWMLTMGREGGVAIRVQDVAGRVVREITKGHMEAGEHAIAWNGTDEDGKRVGAGVYFLSVEGPDLDLKRRVVLVR
jgi:flagellar hook assembly protein FlgD